MELSQIIILCVGLGLVGFILFFGRSKSKSENYQPLFEEGDQAPELTARVRLGEYLSGFPDFTGEASLVSCGITEDNFEFRKGMKGPKIGIIPRKDVKSVSVVKEGKNYCVSICWAGVSVGNCRSVVIFDHKKDEADAVNAAENIKPWIKGDIENTAV
ncbi:MAG: hypothetical protein V2B19_33145 [Pseudomonadota bacterium]